ncbi:condensin complex non-SMC subunit Cnd1 [Schizosaccharomyces japonicus yFS275]|uniref:Condensin complex subunit 1 n=1 Tax=Schizosaccharomyces japonicus (strain yFS275 / FY16936) TaxID=402676 RepID=B6K3H7_SCHJY|nr:condensin complex non-SMC subunit Cnd1 [Schizosaccharomyces japonicus yFS275]EEB08034.1 condensin complex non-SMC subunit Cnd1 [Schizosaccharomyces japonicus yFS275]
MAFNLLENVKKYVHEGNDSILAEKYREIYDVGQVAVLNGLIDYFSSNIETHFELSQLEQLYSLCANFHELPSASKNKIVDLVSSIILSESSLLEELISQNRTDFSVPQENLEAFGIAFTLIVNALSKNNQLNIVGNLSSAKDRKKDVGNNGKGWAGSAHVCSCLDAIYSLLQKRLSRAWITNSEKEMFLSMFLRPTYLFMESEVNMKLVPLRTRIFKVIALAVKSHDHGSAAQTTIIQQLQYFEHLPEHLAELLHITTDQYAEEDLIQSVLCELCSLQFNNNDTKGPKHISAFLIRLSALNPRPCLKQLTQLVKFLGTESYTLRCAVMEVVGNILLDLLKVEGSEAELVSANINSLLDLLKERMLDINPYCRSKILQTYLRVFELPIKYPQRRQEVAEISCICLQDRSSNVRRNSIKLISKLLATHPFSAMYNGLLKREQWEQGLEAINKQLDVLKPDTSILNSEQEVDESLLEDATIIQEEGTANSPKTSNAASASATRIEEADLAKDDLLKLQLTKQFYLDALKFITTVEKSSTLIGQLMGAKNKSEVIDVMDFFVFAESFGISNASAYIKKMIHLIWVKGTSEEGNSIQNHLIECYSVLFFNPPPQVSSNDAANYTARNLITLTYNSSLAELTSLEQMLCILMQRNFFVKLVINKLWQVYGYLRKEISRTQRRGAIIVLSMLALGNSEVVLQGLDLLVQVGLSEPGFKDLILARYTCTAIKRIGGKKNNKRASLPNSHLICQKLAQLLCRPIDTDDWYALAEQAVDAIYAVSQHPDELSTEIINKFTGMVFSRFSNPKSNDMDEDKDEVEEIPAFSPTRQLAHLLFLVGHIGIKQLVYIESFEAEFKLRKAELDKGPSDDDQMNVDKSEPSEFDMIAGTSEDDFTDAMTYIRERELLYGENSLLARFSPLVVELCSKNTTYSNKHVLAAASLTLTKFMCISQSFCAKHLPLLITILEKSDNSLVRNNLVIGLADLTMCFNQYIDQNSEYLYRRLSDDEPSVKKTCFMTLAFLILAGQIKIKGQLGIMARCLEDKDPRVSSLAHMFFSELSAKDNAVYNNFIDIFSVLSKSAEELDADDSMFKRIIKFLMSFIEKEKFTRQLAERLASRLNKCSSKRQWDQVVYALSLLPHKLENIQKQIADGYRY